MSIIEKLENEIKGLENRKIELLKELELEKQKTEIEYPFKDDELHWVVYTDGGITDSIWIDNKIDTNRYAQGNIFKTKAEAIKERDRRALLTRFRQFRDKCNGDWKPDWKNDGECYNIDITYNDAKAVLGVDWHRYFNPFCLFGYFKEQKDVERAIELFGDEIIRLYLEG